MHPSDGVIHILVCFLFMQELDKVVFCHQHFLPYIDDLINRLEISVLGCNINGIYLGCLLYTDDIILLSQSVTPMQIMLEICGQFANEMDITFNADKSVAMRIGSRYKVLCSLLQLSGRDLIYVNKIKYLGVYITASSKLCAIMIIVN